MEDQCRLRLQRPAHDFRSWRQAICRDPVGIEPPIQEPADADTGTPRNAPPDHAVRVRIVTRRKFWKFKIGIVLRNLPTSIINTIIISGRRVNGRKSAPGHLWPGAHLLYSY